MWDRLQNPSRLLRTTTAAYSCEFRRRFQLWSVEPVRPRWPPPRAPQPAVRQRAARMSGRNWFTVPRVPQLEGVPARDGAFPGQSAGPRREIGAQVPNRGADKLIWKAVGGVARTADYAIRTPPSLRYCAFRSSPSEAGTRGRRAWAGEQFQLPVDRYFDAPGAKFAALELAAVSSGGPTVFAGLRLSVAWRRSQESAMRHRNPGRSTPYACLLVIGSHPRVGRSHSSVPHCCERLPTPGTPRSLVDRRRRDRRFPVRVPDCGGFHPGSPVERAATSAGRCTRAHEGDGSQAGFYEGAFTDRWVVERVSGRTDAWSLYHRVGDSESAVEATQPLR